MKNIAIACFLVFISLLSPSEANPPGPVFLIPVTGEVGPAMAAFIERSVKQADKEKAGLIIFEIDTFGGRVDSALEIVETLLTVDKTRSVSYVKTKAISAGALISLASGRLYMRTGTTIGDCAPITYSKEGVQEMGEKFQSPLRAKFRALAKRNRFPENLAEAMVSKEKEIIQARVDGQVHYFEKTAFDELALQDKDRYQFVKTVVKKGELLTMDDREAVDLSFSRASVADLSGLLDILGVPADAVADGTPRLRRMEKTWSEVLAGYLIAFSPVLIMIGLAAVYLELKSPGFGVPGAIGVICLLLAFSSQYITGMADYTELLIILAGFICLGFEIFILPGFGIAGITGFVLIFIGMVLSLQNFTLPDPDLPWEMDIFVGNIIQVLGICMFSVLLSFLTFRFVLPKIPVPGGGAFLDTTLKESHADSSETVHVRPGDPGMALSELRPSGKAEFHGLRLDVITEGEFIPKGRPVKIIRLTKNKIVVEQIEVSS